MQAAKFKIEEFKSQQLFGMCAHVQSTLTYGNM